MSDKFVGKYKQVDVVGLLIAHGREYKLLSPTYVDGDWEDAYFRRFVVTPNESIGWVNDPNEIMKFVYGYARHLIVGAAEYMIEFQNARPILVEFLEVPSEIEPDADDPVTLIEDEHGEIIGVEREEGVYTKEANHWFPF